MGTFAEASNAERKYISDKHRKIAMAKELFVHSLIKEDVDLRDDARCSDCLEELIMWRDLALDFVRRQSDFPPIS